MENYLDYVGKTFINTSGHKFVVLEYTGMNQHKQRTYTVKFCLTGSIREHISLPNLRDGKVKDYYAPVVAGVGYLGMAKKSEHIHEYQVWSNMLARCYQPRAAGYRWYGGQGTTVCDRWLSFENFLCDLPHIHGYDQKLFDSGKLRLDKDLAGHNVYSQEHCCFVTHSENMKEAFGRYNRNKSRKIAVFPDGHQELVTNLTDFCKEHNLEYRNVYHCLNDDMPVDLHGFSFFYDKSVTTIQSA